jgi:hypothetical protein
VNENSLLYWWPNIKDLGIPVPKTEIIMFDNPLFWIAAQEAAKRLGFPVFMRTDLCSGKHDWEKSCFVKDEFALVANFDRVVEHNRRWQMLGIYPQAMVLREFLDLETAFTAFEGNMPINKEVRCFVKDGSILCKHPYWPETAFDRHPARMAHDPEWRTKLQQLQTLSSADWSIINYEATTVASNMQGHWSVDFAKGKNGLWYLIDMALAYNSFHPRPCQPTNGVFVEGEGAE